MRRNKSLNQVKSVLLCNIKITETLDIDNTIFVGKVLHHFTRLPSTNEYATELLNISSVIEGTVVSTAHQFKGKGQMGNTWESSPDKNIAMSVIFCPNFLAVSEQFYLNIAVCLAVRDTIFDFGKAKTQIKWSNDILVNGKKVAGILIQNSLLGKKIQHSIVGIGINVNQSIFSENLPQASSLFLASAQSFDLSMVMNRLCGYLEQYYLMLKQQKYQALKAAYFQHLFQYQEWAAYQLPDASIIQGKIVDVLDSGQLVMEHSSGLNTYQFKEIKFVFR